MRELDRIFEQYHAGMYTELETYVRIARLTTKENIDEIIQDLPARNRRGFAEWLRIYPYKREAKTCVGEPLDSLTDELLGITRSILGLRQARQGLEEPRSRVGRMGIACTIDARAFTRNGPISIPEPFGPDTADRGVHAVIDLHNAAAEGR